ncbi:MAG: hypothetical protein WC682_04925 [Parcubacteria group bacterium]
MENNELDSINKSIESDAQELAELELRTNQIKDRFEKNKLIKQKLEGKNIVAENFNKDLEIWGLSVDEALKNIETRLADWHPRVGGIDFKAMTEKGFLLKEIAVEGDKIELVGGIIGKVDELKEKGLELAKKSAESIMIRINAGEKDLNKHFPLIIGVFKIFDDNVNADKYQKIYEEGEQLLK